MNKTVFKEDINCWRTGKIEHGAMLVDCANFYRALHNAISKAKHSIFIVGWDIDSRIRLLRGDDEANTDIPSVAGDLFAWKAQQNPDLQVYLLRWDASFAFIGKREWLGRMAWRLNTPSNVHAAMDETIPIGGSHHQKIIIIDDEIAFTGGMDIAVQRWDERDHRINEPERTDVEGPYGPYHDIQFVMSGPVVKDLAYLVRWRWENATGKPSLPIRTVRRDDLDRVPQAWPTGLKPFFRKIDCALTLTIPEMGHNEPIYEVQRMYPDLINRAEKFIYIENQFASRKNIAAALNKRLRQCEDLRVVLVSSYNPQGLFESEALWAARIDFKKILEGGISPDRVRMVCSSICDEHGIPFHKRIHSKILVVDDLYLVVGSSNLNNRSMTMDTECDLVVAATTADHRRMIETTRNDLLGEHTGRKAAGVKRLFEKNAPLDELLNTNGKNCYVLKEIDDTKFTDQNFQKLAGRLADPGEPLIPPLSLTETGNPLLFRNPRKHVLIGAILLLIALIATVVSVREHLDWLSPQAVRVFMETSRGTAWALPLVCLIYVIGGLIFFPVTVISLATAAVFGPIWGPVYGLCGALLSAALLFWIGHLAGERGLRKLAGDRIRKIDAKLQQSGIIGMAAVRMLPIAPYSLVNLVAGVSSIRFFDFMAGSFLGLLPGLLAKGIVGDSLARVFIDPTTESVIYLVTGIVFWLVMIVSSQKFANYWQARKTA